MLCCSAVTFTFVICSNNKESSNANLPQNCCVSSKPSLQSRTPSHATPAEMQVVGQHRSSPGQHGTDTTHYQHGYSLIMQETGFFCGRPCDMEHDYQTVWEIRPSAETPSSVHPRPTQPSIHPGSVNEYQLRLGRQRQVWFIPIADERGVCR